MYYYYYYYAPETIKVSFKIKFRNVDKNPVELEQLLEFLKNINDSHKVTLFLTQKEYQKDGSDLSRYKEDLLLSYHQLQTGKITRENPFYFEFSFYILPDGLSMYWTIWKVLIEICKRYGNSSDNLRKTIEKILNEDISIISTKVKKAKRQIKLKELLENQNSSLKMDLLVEQIKLWLFQILSDPKFKKIYDSFCTNSIEITDLISNVENLLEQINLEGLTDKIRNFELNLIKK